MVYYYILNTSFLAITAGQVYVPCFVTYQGLHPQSELIVAHRVKTIAPLDIQVSTWFTV